VDPTVSDIHGGWKGEREREGEREIGQRIVFSVTKVARCVLGGFSASVYILGLLGLSLTQLACVSSAC
jgi:hypothetical protein